MCREARPLSGTRHGCGVKPSRILRRPGYSHRNAALSCFAADLCTHPFVCIRPFGAYASPLSSPGDGESGAPTRIVSRNLGEKPAVPLSPRRFAFRLRSRTSRDLRVAAFATMLHPYGKPRTSLWRPYHGVQSERCVRNCNRFSDEIQLAAMDTYRAFTKGFHIAGQPCSSLCSNVYRINCLPIPVL